MDSEFALLKKSELKSVAYENKSLMPPYDKLQAKDLQDLLAYLDTLRGNVAATHDTMKAIGIH
jgi:hypothetical protein